MTLPIDDVTTVTNKEGEEVEVPSRYLCPITLEAMVHPLMTRAGRNFERDAILDWLREGTGSCPLTRNPLAVSDLISNKQLEGQIRHWRLRNKVKLPEEYRERDPVDAKFCGFLKLSTTKDEELIAHHTFSTMSLMSLSTAIVSHRRASTSTARRNSPAGTPTTSPRRRARRTGEGRRNYLARILATVTADLDDT